MIPTECSTCGHMIADGEWPFCPHELTGGFAAQDDTLTGGARWMHNLARPGEGPLWVETNTQLRNEMADRQLVFADRNNYNRDDKSPWATKTRLRPGARDDGFPGLGQ